MSTINNYSLMKDGFKLGNVSICSELPIIQPNQRIKYEGIDTDYLKHGQYVIIKSKPRFVANSGFIWEDPNTLDGFYQVEIY